MGKKTLQFRPGPPIPSWRAQAGRPPTTLLRPTLQVVDASPHGRYCKTGRRAPLAIPFVIEVVGPPSTPCSAHIGRSRGWRAFARHDVIAIAVSPTCYFNACG